MRAPCGGCGSLTTMNDRPGAAPATGRKTAWAWTIGTFFGAGLLKPGPGTWGSVAATLLWLGVAHFSRQLPFDIAINDGVIHRSVPNAIGNTIAFLGVLLATSTGIPAATRVSRESGREDPGHVVIDEVAGQWLTLLVCKPDWQHALLGLGLFRLFDITKPWPARQLEHLPGGWGIMLDDLAAGVYGLLALLLIQHWW